MTYAGIARHCRYVSSLKEFPIPDKPLGALGTELFGAHNYHNHPSGVAEPSAADHAITRRLVDALALVDVRVLDHLVVGHGQCTSMAEWGML